MTPDALAAWQRRCSLKTAIEAARVLGIATGTYRAKRGGRASIGRQTELLCRYYEAFGQAPAEVVDLASPGEPTG